MEMTALVVSIVAGVVAVAGTAASLVMRARVLSIMKAQHSATATLEVAHFDIDDDGQLKFRIENVGNAGARAIKVEVAFQDGGTSWLHLGTFEAPFLNPNWIWPESADLDQDVDRIRFHIYWEDRVRTEGVKISDELLVDPPYRHLPNDHFEIFLDTV